MDIEFVEGKKKGYFKGNIDGVEAARLSLTRLNEDTIRIDHTEVKKRFKGEGLGTQLVMEVVKYAREENFLIEIDCPFAQRVFDKNPEIQDLINK